MISSIYFKTQFNRLIMTTCNSFQKWPPKTQQRNLHNQQHQGKNIPIYHIPMAPFLYLSVCLNPRQEKLNAI